MSMRQLTLLHWHIAVLSYCLIGILAYCNYFTCLIVCTPCAVSTCSR